MEANREVITKMISEYGIDASPEAKDALINFTVLYGEKLVRTCMLNKPAHKDIKTEDIRTAY